jgi:hypothetical protein
VLGYTGVTWWSSVNCRLHNSNSARVKSSILNSNYNLFIHKCTLISYFKLKKMLLIILNYIGVLAINMYGIYMKQLHKRYKQQCTFSLQGQALNFLATRAQVMHWYVFLFFRYKLLPNYIAYWFNITKPMKIYEYLEYIRLCLAI